MTRSAGVIRAGALSLVALAALGATRLVHGSLVSHATDPATYGLVGTLLGTTVIASLVLPGGLASAAAKFIALHRGADDPAAARAVHRLLSRVGTVAAGLLGVGTALVAARLFDLGRADTAAVGLLTAAYSLYSVDKAALYGYGRVQPYATLEVVTSALAIGATVLVVAAGWRGYLLPLALGYAVFSVGARWILRADRHPGTAVPNRGEIVGYAALASVGTLAGAGFLQGTQLLAFWYAPPAEVAYLAAAVALVAPLYFLPRALGLALFPAMAGAHGAGDVDAVRHHADGFTRALAVLLALPVGAALLLAPLVLSAFGGKGLADGAPILRLMLVATYLAVIQVPAVNALASGRRDRSWIPATSAVTGCLMGLAVVVVLGGPLGATGVAIGYLAGTAVTAGIPVVVVWREHRMCWTGPLLRSLTAVAVAFVAAGVVELPGSAIVLAAALALVATDIRRVWTDGRYATRPAATLR